MKNIVIATLIYIAVIIMLIPLSYRFRAKNAERISNDAESYVVEGTSNDPYDYQWFLKQYITIISVAANAKYLDDEDKKDEVMMDISSMVDEYNSRSSQERNKGRYKYGNLPDYINPYDITDKILKF